MEPEQPRLAILSGFGSRGDVNPMLAIATSLRRRGFDCVLSVGAPYRSLVEAAGVTAETLLSDEEFDAFLQKPRLWTEWGMLEIVRNVLPRCLEPQWQVIERHYRPGRTVLVAHPLDLASRVFRDLHPQVPLVSVHLAPSTLRTPADPPRLSSRRWEPRGPQWLMRFIYWLADQTVLQGMVARPLNQFRRQQQLPTVSRPLNAWWYSPDRVLAMFPEWFSPHPNTRLPQTRCVGFPLDDGPVDDEQQQRFDILFEQIRRMDRPPVVFTAGTAHRQASRFFEMATRVASSLSATAILLSPQADQIEGPLPDHVLASGYVPLHLLLPHVAALVHHGGVGTTSAAMAAGCPQLVIPRAFDQFDNAARVVRLGCGLQLAGRKLNEPQLGARLKRLLAEHTFQSTATALTAQVESGAADRAAASIAEFMPASQP